MVRKELSSNVKVELREFSDVPVITISSSVTSSSVNLAEATVKRIAEMDFLLRKHLDRLAHHAGKVFDWVNRFVNSMLSNYDVTPFWPKQQPLLRDVDEFAWRSSENSSLLTGWRRLMKSVFAKMQTMRRYNFSRKWRCMPLKYFIKNCLRIERCKQAQSWL